MLAEPDGTHVRTGEREDTFPPTRKRAERVGRDLGVELRARRARDRVGRKTGLVTSPSYCTRICPYVRHPEYDRSLEERGCTRPSGKATSPSSTCSIAWRRRGSGRPSPSRSRRPWRRCFRTSFSVDGSLITWSASPASLRPSARADWLTNADNGSLAFTKSVSRGRAVSGIARAATSCRPSSATRETARSNPHQHRDPRVSPRPLGVPRLDPRAASSGLAELRASLRHKAPRPLAPGMCLDPRLGGDLAAAGVRYTILDAQGIELAWPAPPFGIYAPILSPSGVAFFARDPHSSREVWSRQSGYPGDPAYREFYRDVGFDLPTSALLGEVGPDGTRVMTGLKLHRVTGPGPHKEPYDPDLAAARAAEHAKAFIAGREAAAKRVSARCKNAILVAPLTPSSSVIGGSRARSFLSTVFVRWMPRRNEEALSRPPSGASSSASPTPWSQSPPLRRGVRVASATFGRAPRPRVFGGMSTTPSNGCEPPSINAGVFVAWRDMRSIKPSAN